MNLSKIVTWSLIMVFSISELPGVAQSGGAEVLWDHYGVPHIYGDSAGDMYYAYGWAQMQNHANLILNPKASDFRCLRQYGKDILLHVTRGDRGGKPFKGYTVGGDQEFCKVPFDLFPKFRRKLIFQVSENRVGLLTIHHDFFCQLKGDPEIHLAMLLHRLIGFGLLAQELVTWESNDHKALISVFLMQGFQFHELRSESAPGGSIYNHHCLAFIISHGKLFSLGSPGLQFIKVIHDSNV